MSDQRDAQAVEFEREDRFIVIKRKHLSRAKEEALRTYLYDDGINTVECVVVESDWPEYETVWAMIEARCTTASLPAETEDEDDICANGVHCCCCGPGEPCCDCGTVMPAASEQEPVAMTREEHHLEYLKQMAAYTGPVISFDVREPYYLASCDACGWVGSSELCGTDSWGDDSDVYCPRCHASGADCGKVADRIPAPSDQEKLVRELIEALDDAANWLDALSKGTLDRNTALVKVEAHRALISRARRIGAKG